LLFSTTAIFDKENSESYRRRGVLRLHLIHLTVSAIMKAEKRCSSRRLKYAGIQNDSCK
jgi:hypothetical protein